MDFLRFLMSDILSESAVLVGLITLIGLVTQKKPVTECIKGTVKTIMGFMILGTGTDLVASSLSDFASIFQHIFGIRGVVSNNETIASVAQKSLGKEMATTMFSVMVISIMIAHLTSWKFIFLTSHHTLFMSMTVTVILATAGTTDITFIAADSLVVGVVVVFFPAIAHPCMRKVIDSDDVAIGHLSTLPYVLAGFIDSRFGNREHSTGDMNAPKSLLFLRDMPIAISLTMSIVFLVMCLFTGIDMVKEFSGGRNWFMLSIIQSVTLAADVYIILQGVHMVIAKIVPVFEGISDKLVSNARPVLDCPVVFPYAPSAALVGFLSSFATGLIGMSTLHLLNMVMIIPGVVPYFFVGAAAEVFSNVTGERHGAISGASAQDLLTTLLSVFLLPVLGDIGFANTTFSDAGFGVLGILLGIIAR